MKLPCVKSVVTVRCTETYKGLVLVVLGHERADGPITGSLCIRSDPTLSRLRLAVSCASRFSEAECYGGLSGLHSCLKGRVNQACNAGH